VVYDLLMSFGSRWPSLVIDVQDQMIRLSWDILASYGMSSRPIKVANDVFMTDPFSEAPLDVRVQILEETLLEPTFKRGSYPVEVLLAREQLRIGPWRSQPNRLPRLCNTYAQGYNKRVAFALLVSAQAGGLTRTINRYLPKESKPITLTYKLPEHVIREYEPPPAPAAEGALLDHIRALIEGPDSDDEVVMTTLEKGSSNSSG
jgi:hypothetical protein